MNENELNKLLKSAADGNKSVDEALNELKSGPFKMDDGDLINLDHHRRLRAFRNHTPAVHSLLPSAHFRDCGGDRGPVP